MNKIVKKVLVVNLYALGDFFLSFPFMNALRKEYPNAKISLVVRAEFAQVARDLKIADEVIENKGVKNIGFLLRLRKLKADVAFAVDPLWVEQFYLWFSRSKKRVGFEEGFFTDLRTVKFSRMFLTDPVFPKQEKVHATKRPFELLKAIGINSKPVPAKIVVPKKVDAKVKKILGKGYWIAFNCFAPWEKKNWVPKNFIALGKKLQKRYGAKIVMGGTDFEANEKIAKPLGALNLARKISITELCALYKNCKFVVTLETGTAHIAKVVGAKTLVLVGPGYPKVFCFSEKNYKFIQKKTKEIPFEKMMVQADNGNVNDVSVQEAFKEIKRILG